MQCTNASHTRCTASSNAINDLQKPCLQLHLENLNVLVRERPRRLDPQRPGGLRIEVGRDLRHRMAVRPVPDAVLALDEDERAELGWQKMPRTQRVEEELWRDHQELVRLGRLPLLHPSPIVDSERAEDEPRAQCGHEAPCRIEVVPGKHR